MQLIKLTRLHIKRLLKNKSVLILSMFMPAIVMCLVTFITYGKSDSGNSINVDFVNYDKGQLGASLIKDFNDNPNFNITNLSEADATKRIQHNASAAAIVIPENFTKSLKNNTTPSVKMLKLTSGNSDVLIESRINSFIANNIISNSITKAVNQTSISSSVNMNAIDSSLANEVNSNKVQVNSKQLSIDKSTSTGAQISVNLAVSFMMFSVIYIALEITERKNDGTLRRSLTSPNNVLVIAGSFVLTFLILGWLEVILMLGSSSLFFKVNWGNLPALFLLFTVLVLVVLGIGLVLCRFSKSPSSVAPIANLTTQVTCLLGGSYMPAQYFPDFLKKISHFMPQSWAVDALTNIALKGKGISAILPDVGILLLFAAALFTAGAAALKGVVQEN